MDDLIVVDDEPSQIIGANAPSSSTNASADPSSFYQSPPKTIAESVMRTRAARRGTPAQFKQSSAGGGLGGPKLQPKLKLKLSEKAQAMASGMSFLGPYDRELDSDEEDLVFEEQFILRMPPGEDCERLRKIVTSREASPDVWMKFKGARTERTHHERAWI
jgi:transcription initiation factor TFIID subunit 7